MTSTPSDFEIILEVVRQRLAGVYPSIGWVFGAKHLAANNWTFPHVIWKPADQGDRYEPPENIGQEPRCLNMVVVCLQAYIRCADLGSALRLRHDVVSALRQVLGNNVRPLDGGWSTQNGSLTTRGEEYILRVELRLPVVAALLGEPTPSVVVEHVDTTTRLSPSGEPVVSHLP